MNELHPVGSEVKHIKRGAGVIIAYNENPTGFYNKDIYPYVIQFPDGYSDYYATTDIQLLK